MKLSNKERVKLLIESTLKEVRLPTGYFKILTRFIVKATAESWDTVFNTNEIVHLDPNNNTVKGWSELNRVWNNKDISFTELRKPEIYRIFSENSRKLTEAEIKEKGFMDALEFNTTVRAFPKRSSEFDLEPSTKINVKVLESVEIDLEKGDEIRGGKFKNKKMIVKDIGKDDLGQPTVNGKEMLKFRIAKLMPKKTIKESILTDEELIKKYGLFSTTNKSLLQFKNDPAEYVLKGLTPDRQHVFVSLKNQLQTYRKKISDLEKVNRKLIS